MTNDRPGSMLLKCYQHCGSESYCYVFDLCFALFVFVLIRMVAGLGAELAYDKNLHKELFDGEVEYERFYRNLRYASMNTLIHLAEVYWDKMVQLLQEDGEPRAAQWFKDNMIGTEGQWMLAHSGPGLLNTNCSLEAHWRKTKAAVLGAAGSSGAGYSHQRTQSNLTGFIEDDSKKSIAEMAGKGQLVSFPTDGVYCKAVFDKLQELFGSYLVVCEPVANDDTDFRNVRRIVAAAEGVSLYSRVIKLRSDHRWVQTILAG